jgi:CHAT domain-containing protein
MLNRNRKDFAHRNRIDKEKQDLTRPFERHLDGEEIDAFISQTGGAEISETLLNNIRGHVATCEFCRQLVQLHKDMQSEMHRLEIIGPEPRGPDCPADESEWLRLVAGLVPEERSGQLMSHATQCDHCGPLLREASNLLDEDLTQSEEKVLAEWSSRSQLDSRMLAERLMEQNEAAAFKKQKVWPWTRLLAWPLPVFAAGTFAFLILATWLGVRVYLPLSADQLLARAYTENRTLEVRIPGAKYAPLHVERSGNVSNFDRPESLLRAEALIAEQSRRNPNDPVWLDAKARAELLDGDYAAALKSLQRALEVQPDSPTLLTDLASAYFVRAKSTDRSVDYGNAIDTLGKVLAKNPDDSIALFNRALACEQMFLYTQTVDDWEHYLRVDPKGEWADEARKRLAVVRNKMNGRSKLREEPLAEPSDLFKVSDESLSSQVDRRFEAYLDRATSDWLPEAYSNTPDASSKASSTRSVVERLARVAADGAHNDHWMSDLLSASGQEGFGAGVKDLAEAVQANDEADTGRAHRNASQSALLLGRTKNRAGELRARLEDLAAYNLDQNGERCDQVARQMEELLDDRPYPWLRAQFEIEAGTCAWLRENLGQAKTHYETASRMAQENGYGELYLRSQDRLAGLEAASGEFDVAWQVLWRGLGAFWVGNYPDVRGYNFYYNVYELARIRHLPRMQVAAWRDGLQLVESSPDVAERAMAHMAMANAAEAAGMKKISSEEFGRSGVLFNQAPRTHTTRVAWLEAETRLAGVESVDGDASQAIALLKPLRTEIDGLSDSFLSILFYSNLGEAESIDGASEEAEGAFQNVIALADRQLRTVEDDKVRLQIVQQSSLAYRTVIQRELLKGNIEGALDLWESYRAAPVRKRDNSAGLDDTSEQQTLHTLRRFSSALSNETVVSYGIFPRGLAVWVADDRGVFVHWSEGDSRGLLSIAGSFREMCADPQSDISELKRNGREVYDRLIAPINDRLDPHRTLVAELDEGLDGVPLEALVGKDGRYFGEQFRVVTSLGMYYRRGSHPSLPITMNAHALVVAVPRPDAATGGRVSPLPDTVEEGEGVAASFKSRVFLRANEATRDSVLAHLPDAAVFHFAGHAVNTSSESGILLSDGVLSTASLRRQSLSRLQLSVLSACDTEYGPTGAFNDAGSLVRAFLSSGVSNVVASRWKVESTSTRQWMEIFYADLLRGASVADSIQRAQAVLRLRAETSHPYYWAAFGEFGAS